MASRSHPDLLADHLLIWLQITTWYASISGVSVLVQHWKKVHTRLLFEASFNLSGHIHLNRRFALQTSPPPLQKVNCMHFFCYSLLTPNKNKKTCCLQVLWIYKEVIQKRIFFETIPFRRQAGITKLFVEKAPNTKSLFYCIYLPIQIFASLCWILYFLFDYKGCWSCFYSLFRPFPHVFNNFWSSFSWIPINYLCKWKKDKTIK